MPTGKSIKIYPEREYLKPTAVLFRNFGRPVYCLLMLFILVLPFSSPLHSQPLSFRHLTVDNGLSQNSVYAILEDHQGFMWFGTADGLNRYDGYQFKTYKSYARDSSTLSNNTIRALCEDRSGTIWVGTDKGLNRYDRLTDTFVRYTSDNRVPFPVGSGYLETLFGDSHDNLWIGTGMSIVCYDSSRSHCKKFTAASGVKEYLRLTSLAEEQDGTVWIGTTAGLTRYNPQQGTLDRIRLPHGSSSNGEDPAIYIISYDSQDSSLWLCAQRLGIIHYHPRSGSLQLLAFNKKTERSLLENPIASVGEDAGEGILIGSVDEGLFAFDKKTHLFTQYKNDQQDPSSLSFNIVRAMARDRSGALWIGTDGAGVNIANPRTNRFVHVQHDPRNPNSLPGNFLKAIYEDGQGSLWVGTIGHGLAEYDSKTKKWTKYLHNRKNRSSLASNVVFAIQGDRNGNLWVGTDSCLMKLDKKRKAFKRIMFADLPSSPENHINKIYEDREGMLWIGTLGHLRIIDPRTGTERHLGIAAPGIAHVGSVMSICEDNGTGVWIATLGDGVYHYDRTLRTLTRHKTEINNANSLTNNFVRAAHCDKSGIVWFATEEGLARFDPAAGRFTAYTERDGLPSDFLYGILEDQSGNLWISTNNGVSKFTEKNPHGSQFRNYRVSDGLQAKEFNTGAYWRNARGEMFFGGVNGYNKFQPDSIGINQHPPRVVITDLYSSDRQIANEGSIDKKKDFRLSYRDNEIMIGFVALEYVQPIENRYAYMLEGEDPDWIQSGTQRFARYTNLRPGEYLFRVKACNNDGTWNEQGAFVRLTIVPPFWMTPWFLVLAFIAGISGIAGSVRYLELRKIKRRMEALEAQHALDRERARISQDMHDEVGSTLTRIAILGELAQRNIREPEETKLQLEKISEMSRHVIDSLGEIVWALNPKNDTLDNLLAYTRQYVAEFFEITPVRCVLEFPDAVQPIPLSAEFRRNIFLTVKEAVHNVVRHANAAEVCVTCSMAGITLSVSVKDNGNGFSSAETGELGNGLANMRKRIEDIGGRIAILSAPGSGTSVSFQVDLPRETPDAHRGTP